VPHGDIEAFAHALQYLAERPTLRTRLGQAARTHAETHLGREAVLARLEAQLQMLAC
jgi:colanic acid biosynthesis glycosyl transferase WcaI